MSINKSPLHIFTVREAYLLVAASMFMGLFISLTLQGLLPDSEHTELINRIGILFGELAILIPPFFILKQRGLKFRDALPLNPVSPISIIMAIVLVVGAIGLVSIFEIIVLPYFPIPEFLKQLETNMIQANLLDNLILVVAATLIAPLVEEFLFRGLLQQSLFYQHGSLLPAIIVPTVIFAIFHVAYLFYLPALIELIALAIMLAWVMAKTGNLLIPILIHGLFNLSSFMGVFVTDLEDVGTLTELGIPWIILSVIFTSVGVIYFKFIDMVVLDEVYLIPPLQNKEI